MNRYCVLDFETTGLDPERDEVVEYAVVRVDESGLGLHLASLCRPERPIPLAATRVHNITDRMVRYAEPFSEHLPALLSFLGDDVFVAHNVPFDLGFLRAYCRRMGLAYEPKTLCTLQRARKLFPFLPSRSLDSVAAHLNIRNPGAHRALDDARTTAQVLVKMLELEKSLVDAQEK